MSEFGELNLAESFSEFKEFKNIDRKDHPFQYQ